MTTRRPHLILIPLCAPRLSSSLRPAERCSPDFGRQLAAAPGLIDELVVQLNALFGTGGRSGPLSVDEVDKLNTLFGL